MTAAAISNTETATDKTSNRPVSQPTVYADWQPTTTEPITVYPGDYGTRFLVLGAEQGLHNRPLSATNLHNLRRHWDPQKAQIGMLTLVCLDDRRYYILDGQHRINTVSSGTAPFTFTALIHRKELLRNPQRMALILSTINSGKPMTTADQLHITSEQSRFVQIMRDNGLEPKFGRNNGYVWDWMTLLRGLHFAELSMVAGKTQANMANRTTDTLSLRFNETPEARMETIARILKDWEQVASAARARGKVTLYTAYSAAAALLLEEFYPGVLKDLAGRIANADPHRLGVLKHHMGHADSAHFRTFLENLMAILNHRRQERHYYTLLGVTGR